MNLHERVTCEECRLVSCQFNISYNHNVNYVVKSQILLGNVRTFLSSFCQMFSVYVTAWYMSLCHVCAYCLFNDNVHVKFYFAKIVFMHLLQTLNFEVSSNTVTVSVFIQYHQHWHLSVCLKPSDNLFRQAECSFMVIQWTNENI